MTSKNSGDVSVIAQNHPDSNFNQLNLEPPKTSLIRSLGFFSAFGLLCASVIHFLTLFSIFPFGKNFLVAQLAIIVIIYVFAILSSFVNRNISEMKIFGIFPSFSYFLVGLILVIYAFINFFVFIPMAHEVTEKGGKYYTSVALPSKFRNGPRKIVEISKNEFISSQNSGARASSGHWLIFFYLPTVYFLSLKAKSRS
jgi:hypothetical protein